MKGPSFYEPKVLLPVLISGSASTRASPTPKKTPAAEACRQERLDEKSLSFPNQSLGGLQPTQQ